jgi:2,3-bisphosphoglycerate-dependent phosphoglycerate mutase
VYSSPYPRARETVEPLAARLGLSLVMVDDLRERVLSEAGRADWLAHVRRSFADPDYALSDGESSRAAKRRVAAVLDELAGRHPDQTVAVGSHGNLIALALQLDDPAVGFDFWQAMPMPAVYTLELDRSPRSAR